MAESMEENKRFKDISLEFLDQLDLVYGDYFAIQHALSHDDLKSVGETARDFLNHLETLQMELLLIDAHQAWMNILPQLKSSAGEIQKAVELNVARIAFEKLSQAIIFVGKTFSSTSHALLLYHCPMAFNNKGADWLQNKSGTTFHD